MRRALVSLGFAALAFLAAAAVGSKCGAPAWAYIAVTAGAALIPWVTDGQPRRPA